MNINAICKLHLLPAKEYYYCGDLNHVVQNCPIRLDMQQLIAKQLEKLMEDLNMVKDIEVQ